MSLHSEGDTVVFQSLLENLSLDDLKGTAAILRALHDAADESVAEGPIKVDFSMVSRTNSVGLFYWIEALRVSPRAVCYVRAPVWMVQQFNEKEHDLLRNAQIQSLYAPFYCPQTLKGESLLLTLGVDLPILNDYTGFEFDRKTSGGLGLEPDFEPNEFFAFFLNNAARIMQR